MKQEEKVQKKVYRERVRKERDTKKNGNCKCGGLCKTVVCLCSVDGQQDNLDMETECDKMWWNVHRKTLHIGKRLTVNRGTWKCCTAAVQFWRNNSIYLN